MYVLGSSGLLGPNRVLTLTHSSYCNPRSGCLGYRPDGADHFRRRIPGLLELGWRLPMSLCFVSTKLSLSLDGSILMSDSTSKGSSLRRRHLSAVPCRSPALHSLGRRWEAILMKDQVTYTLWDIAFNSHTLLMTSPTLLWRKNMDYM